MAAPSPSDYGTAAAAAYGAPLPPGWTVKATSDPTPQSDGFSAVALQDPSGNTIIACEGTVLGTTTYGRSSVSHVHTAWNPDPAGATDRVDT